MKVYKSCYRSHWISPLTCFYYIFFWTDWARCGRNTSLQAAIDEADGTYKFVEAPAWVEQWADRLTPISQAIQWVLDLIHPRIDYVRIDPWDTWSMDHTLADIILPMLKQLQKTKHGSPNTDDEDVPEYLRSHMAQPKENEWDTDSLHFARWDWILDEEIWAFEQLTMDDAEGQFFDHSAYDGSRLGDQEYLNDLTNNVSKVKYDKEGHDKWQARVDNGLRLFGKYFRAHWS